LFAKKKEDRYQKQRRQNQNRIRIQIELKEGMETEELQQFFGLKNPLSLWQYENFIK